MMTKEEKVAYWLDVADYDIETAEAMYKTKRWLYVAFMCHQTIEKTLKAYWSFVRDDIPPKTHNHMRLADGCELLEQMSEEQKSFLDIITNYNIEARYPEDKAALAQTLSPKVCRSIIDDTKVLQQWIKDKLSNLMKP